MADLFDEFGLGGEPATTAGNSKDLFDEFKLDAPKRNTSLAGDLGTDLKRGVQQLPGIVTGLLDIPVAAVTGRRMVSEGYDEIGKLTGFQPSKWAEEARQEYSPQRQAAQAEIDQVWEGGTPTEIAGAYMSNPGYVAGKVVESLPQMAAGGLAGRAVLGAARGAGLLAAPATAGQAARQAALGAGIGEGAVIAGGSMEQIDDSVDARRAAAASLGAGVIGGALGGMGSRVAQRAGLIDAEGALAGGIQRSASEAPGLARRMTGGAITEGLLEELPQSVQEQMWQNWAEQNPLMEGAARAGVEGALAGSALGAGINVIPRGQSTAQTDQSAEGTAPEELPGSAGPDLIQPTPSAENPAPAPVERPDPANGPLSAAASLLPGAVPQGPAATPAGQQAKPAPASPEEARIREAIADVEMRARLGGMNPVLAAERARLGGELLALQQPAAEQQERLAIGDQRSDFYTAGNGFTSRERDPWVNPANNRSSDPYDRFPGIDQVPPQPLEGELLSDVQGEPAAQSAGQRGIGADARPRLTREGELLGGEVVPQGARTGIGREGATLDGQNRAMPVQPDTRGVVGADGSSVLEGELVGGDLQPGVARQAIGGRVIEGELSPREQRALATTFKKRGAAELARKSLPAPERFTVEEQGETFAIRQLPPPVPSIAGREIDSEWSEFAPESGTLAIPRAEMPQIKAEHRGAMVRFLNARGIQHEEQSVPAAELKPTQAEFSRQKVEQAKGFTGGDRAILVSSDGHVVDGHHQWLARREAGGDVRVIRLKAPIRDLLPAVAEFPSATQEAGAQPMTIGRQPKAPQRGQRRSVDRDRDSVVQAAIRLGGITSQWRQDTTGDTKGKKNIPGVGALWSDKTGTSLDDMASLLDQHGYVPAGEMDKDGGVSWLQAAIRDELGGRAHYAPDSARQIEQAEQELLNRYAEAVARAIDEREAEYARIEAEYGPDAAADARSFDEAMTARSEHLDGAIEDVREQQETVVDGELATEADAARRDDELRQADGREGRPAGENVGETFQLQQQTEAGLAEQARQQQAREQAEAEARRKVEQKAQADAELNDFALTGSDRPADVGAARGQSDLFGAQPVRNEAEAPAVQQDPAGEARHPDQGAPVVEVEPDKTKRRAKPVVEKIDDTGDSLYWNRKNPWRGGGLKWEQIAGENEALRAKLVTKARVWAKPDWQAYLDELLPKLPEQQRDAAVLVARLTKQVYDALPAAPKDRTEKGLQAYIEVIERVRSAAEALLQDGERHVVLLNGLTRRSGDILSFARQAGTMPIFDAVFPEIAAGGRFQRGTLANERGQVIGNKAIKAMQWSVADAGKALKDIKAGWPASQEAWQKQGMRVLARDTLRAAGVEQLRGVHAAMIYDGRNHLATVRDSEGARREFATQAEAESAAQAELQSWAPFLLLDKRNRLVGGFDSEELAIEAARASVKREVKPTVRETPLADAEIQRAGSERRLAGQNVTADQLRDTFGFRGVNFGKYVPQGERQSHLNRAFDAMHDLAEVLGVPPRAMSLNGMLGLAFGAQGNGGKAAAHFVPGVNEINLTRNAGAGSLAHEWAHALDHYFGVQGGMASKEKPYASHIGPRGAAGELRSEIRTAIVNIGAATRSMEETEEQVRQRAAERVEHARQRQAAYLERNQVAEKVAGNAEAEAALARIMAGEPSEYVELPSRKRNKDYVPADVKAVADAIGFDAAQTVDMHDTVSSLCFALEDQRKHFQKRLVHTSFYKSSQALDGKGKPYWSTPHEMFARSFEAFVLDRLMERGAQNDYLVSPVKRDQGATDPGYPYPAGLERAAINRAFDTLIGAIETRETEAGVGLYRLGDGAGVSAAEVAAALAASPELSGIQVVQSFEELPLAARIRAKSDGLSPGDMRGVFRPDGQYLVADNLDSLEDAVHTAVHEMVGHLGVRGVLGSELNGTLERIYSSEAATEKGRQRIAQIREAYAALLSRRSEAEQRLLIAEEIVAHLAESGDRPGVLQRFVSKVRAVLRRLFPQVRWTYNDILGLIEQSRQWLQREAGKGEKIDGSQRYSRRGWDEAFPDVELAHPLSFLNNHPDYAAAKAGDDAAALRVARDAVTPEFVERVRAMIPAGSRPRIVPVLAVEGAGKNRIPLMAAEVLAQRLGLETDTSPVQAEKVGRTQSNALERIANQPTFAGEVTVGDYLILDDTLTQGGTLAQLKTHIEDNGGRVLGAVALTGKNYSRKLAIDPSTLAEVRGKYGDIEPWWRETFGYGFEGLTQSEARTLLTFDKGRLSPDGIRDRIAAARDEGLFRVGQAAAGDRPGTEAPLDSSDTRYRLAESLRAAFDRATGPTSLDPTDPFAVENRRLREEDRTLWDKAKKVFARQFAPGGLLPKSVFAEKIIRDSEFQAVEFDVRHLVGALNRAVKQEFGADLDGLDAAQVERLAESLTGQLDPTLPEVSKAAVVAMRQYIDRLSADYLTIIQGRIDELQAKAGSSEQAAQAAKDAQRRFKDALEAATEPVLVQALADQKATLRERKLLKKAMKGLKGEAKQAARQVYDDAVQAHERAKRATFEAMPPALRKLNTLAGEARTAAAAARAAKPQAEAEAALYEKIKANIGAYVHRSYQAFDDPQWFKSVPTATLNAARQYLIDGYLAMGETDAEARRMAEVTMGEILKTGTAYDSMEAMISEGKLGAKDLSVLIKRKEIAPEIRALLGEYRDPRLNFAKSATKMGRLIWNQRFLDRVREVGMGSFLFTENERPADATVQIAGEQSDVYAPLNGLWTFPEVAQAFRDALGKEQMSDLYRTVVRLNGMVKYGKTVLSPTTAMRNWQSAMFFSLGNGHFDLSQMKKSIAAFREQVTQNATGSDLAYLRKLKQLGVVYDTPYAGEMAALLADARMEELLSSKSGTGLKWLRKANQFAQGFYSFGDDFWKIIGFENEKAGLLAAGMDEAAAEKEAAHRIRSTYPTYSMIGRGIQWLRRFPLVGTFVSFPAEIIRTSANMLRITAADLKSDNPQMRALGRKRAAGMAFVSGAFYALAALTAAAFGVDDDEEEALRDLSPDWSKNSTFLFLGRDDDGKLRSVDLSFLDPYGYWKRPITAMLRDQPWEDAAASGLGDMVAPFFGADIAAGAIFQVLANQKASGGRVYDENADSVDQLQDIANHMRKALQPGFVSNAERLWLAGSGASREGSGQPYDMRDEVVTLLGWRANTLDAQTGLYYRAFDFTDGLSQAKKTLTRELRSVNAVSDGDIREARDAAQRQYNKAFAEMARLVHAAEVSGLSRQEIVKTLRQSNIAQANIFALMQGRVPPMDVGLQAQQRAVQQARVMQGAEHAAEVARRFRVAREMREGM